MAQDGSYVSASSGTNGILYLRASEPFAISVMQSRAANAAYSGRALRFFRFIGKDVDTEVSEGVGTTALQRDQAARSFKPVSPVLPAAVAFGLAAGLLFAIPRWLAAPVLLTNATLALVKLVTQCSSCANERIAGVDASVVGVVGFLALAAATLLLSRSRPGRAACVVVLIATLCWQLFHASELQSVCVPCTLIAFLTGTLASSGAAPLTQAASDGEVVTPRVSVLVSRLSWAMPVVVPISLILATPAALQSLSEAQALTLLHPPTWDSIKMVAALGIAKPTVRQVMYIGRRGCRPCEEALTAIDSQHVAGLTYYYAGVEAPDTLRIWHKIPKGNAVPATPSLLFVDNSGAIVLAQAGFETAPEFVDYERTNIQQFLTAGRSKAQGN